MRAQEVDFPTDSCQSHGCNEKPQLLVQFDVSGGTEELGLCVTCTFVIQSQGAKVEVVGP